MQIVTLLTDYGTRDHYVAAVKGVILDLAPRVTIVDITHEVEAHDIGHGAFVLWQAFSWFPAGTIHVAVVDPGVGSQRRIVLAQYAGRFVIAPDNGLLTLVHREYPIEALHVVTNRRLFLPTTSATFHGRDMIAPAAAHLANGVRLWEFGPETDHLTMLPLAHRAQLQHGALHGQVLHVDRFGNLVTNIHQEQWREVGLRDRTPQVRVNGEAIGPVRSAYHEVERGLPVAYVGSAQLLEIALNQGRAVDRFGPVEHIVVQVG